MADSAGSRQVVDPVSKVGYELEFEDTFDDEVLDEALPRLSAQRAPNDLRAGRRGAAHRATGRRDAVRARCYTPGTWSRISWSRWRRSSVASGSSVTSATSRISITASSPGGIGALSTGQRLAHSIASSNDRTWIR